MHPSAAALNGPAKKRKHATRSKGPVYCISAGAGTLPSKHWGIALSRLFPLGREGNGRRSFVGRVGVCKIGDSPSVCLLVYMDRLHGFVSQVLTSEQLAQFVPYRSESALDNGIYFVNGELVFTLKSLAGGTHGQDVLGQCFQLNQPFWFCTKAIRGNSLLRFNPVIISSDDSNRNSPNW